MLMTAGKRHWTSGQIAALSDLQLAGLNFDEMVEIVLVSGVPVRDFDRIHAMESDALVRLVHWARQFCSDRTSASSRAV